MVLALESQRVVDFLNEGADDVSICAVGHRPHQITLGIGQFLGRTQMVQMVVVDTALFRAVAIHQCEGLEGVWLVDVAAVLVAGFFGDQAVALPQKFGAGRAIGFGDAAAEGRRIRG